MKTGCLGKYGSVCTPENKASHWRSHGHAHPFISFWDCNNDGLGLQTTPATLLTSAVQKCQSVVRAGDTEFTKVPSAGTLRSYFGMFISLTFSFSPLTTLIMTTQWPISPNCTTSENTEICSRGLGKKKHTSVKSGS